MLKAVEYEVDYNFCRRADGTEINMNIQTGFKTYTEAEEWSHKNTIDGKVSALYPIDDWDE